MSNIAINFKYEGSTIRDSHDLGILQELSDTGEVVLKISHNSNKQIKDCGIFISPFSGLYVGSETSENDYNKILWFADNFEGYGLAIKQRSTVYGEVYRQDSRRLIDISRLEERDIFTGANLELLSGFSTGEKRKILGYSPENTFFDLQEDFSVAQEGDKYKIDLYSEKIFKSKQGAGVEYPILLINKGGIIDRFEEVEISIQLKIPPFMKKAGVCFFDLNLKYTPGE